MSDLEDVFAYSSDEEVTRFLRWGPHRTLEQIEGYICDVLQEYQEGRDGPWGIEHKETGSVIGAIHLMAISVQHSKAEIGFLLSRAYWGRGLMLEALASVLAFSFERIGWEYIFQKGAFRDVGVYSMLKQDYQQR